MLLLLSGRSVDQVERLFELTADNGGYWGDVARLYLAQLYIAQNSLDKAEQTLLPIQDQGDLQYDARLGLAKIALYRQNYQSEAEIPLEVVVKTTPSSML